MEKIYKKKFLNLNEQKLKDQINILTTKDNCYIDCEIVATTKENIKIKYDLNTKKNLINLKSSFNTTKLRVLLNIINLYNAKNNYLESTIDVDNIYYTEDLNVYFLERKIKNQEDVESPKEVLLNLKRILGTLFLHRDKDDIKNTDEKSLKKNKEIKNIINAKTLEEFRTLIEEKIEELEVKFKTTEIIIEEKKIKKLKKSKLFLSATQSFFVIILLFLSVNIIPFYVNEINIVKNYEVGNYSKILEILDKVKAKRLNPTIQYYAAKSVIKVENLSDLQKDNILSNLSTTTETSILEYWILIGQGKLDDAYGLSLSLQDLDLQTYVLLKQNELIDIDEDLTGEEKAAEKESINGKIEKINQEKETIIEKNKTDGE